MAQHDEEPTPTASGGTPEPPAPTEKKFFVVAAVTIDTDSWREAYGDDPVTPENVAGWLTFQFINSVQQGVDVFSATEVPMDAKIAGIPIATNNA